MNWLSKLKQNWKGGAAGALLAVGLGVGLLRLPIGLGEYLIHLSYDVPFHNRPVYPPQEVVLVYMDEVSHRELHQSYDKPWDRGLYARLLERLTAEKAKGAAFDIVFSDTNLDHLDGDERFARAIKANGKVVLGAELRTEIVDGQKSMRIIPAAELFYDAAADSGFVELTPDQDFMVRRPFHVPLDKENGVYIWDSYTSMTWQLAVVCGAKCTADPKQRFVERWMNYYGPSELHNISFVGALEPNVDCPVGYFSNKVVFVGTSLKSYFSGQRKDELRTPYTGSRFCPAVDVQATQFLNLLRGDWLTRPSAEIETLIIAVCGLVFGFGLSHLRPFTAVGIAIIGALLITLGVQFVFDEYRIWFPWLIIVAVQIPIALFWSVVFNSVQLYVQNRLFEQSLQMYLSPKLVKKFSSEKDILKPGAKKQELTILFSDIASFTSISEGVEGDELANAMNKYFESAVSDCIHKTDGTIVKYIGDAIFAFWNAPEAQVDHAMRGCEAALLFRSQPPHFVNGQQLITRIGLHSGVANVGNFGSTQRVDYTALGENINLASRMEGLNKYLGTIVLITADTYAGVEGRLLTRFLGKFQLKGFEKAVGVYELAGHLDKAESLRPVHEPFAEGLKLFWVRDFVGAELAFRKVLEVYANDGPSKFYLKFLADLHDHPLPDDWDGEVELKEK